MARDGYPRTRDVHDIHTLVCELVDLHRLTPELRAHRVLIEWPTLVGPTIARVTAPDSLRDGVLAVWVKTSPWMQELRLLRDRVIADINAGIGGPPLVTELRLHFGSARIIADDDPLAMLRRARDRRRPGPRRAPVSAPPDRAQAIERDAAGIEDPELRALIVAVRTRHDR
jgi:predicted nucleic acid-binding Zn ribbon protein